MIRVPAFAGEELFQDAKRSDRLTARQPFMVALINLRLQSAVRLQSQTGRMLWNAEGPDSGRLHELFEAIAGAAKCYAEQISQRIALLGGTAQSLVENEEAGGTPRTSFSEMNQIGVMNYVLGKFHGLICRTIEQAHELDDPETADLFEEILRDIDHWLWFLAAYASANQE